MANNTINAGFVAHTATADLYSLVAYMMQRPTQGSVDSLQQISMAHDVASIASELGVPSQRVEGICQRLDALRDLLAADADALSTLRIEYTRLFTVPKHALVAPYEDRFVAQERARAGIAPADALMFVGPAAVRAEKAYRQAGLKPESLKAPADYIVTELEFASLVHARIAQALMDDDAALVDELSKALEAFKEAHANAWFVRFFARVAECAEHDMYRCAAAVAGLLAQVEGLEDQAPGAQ